MIIPSLRGDSPKQSPTAREIAHLHWRAAQVSSG